jgi:carbamate kinase
MSPAITVVALGGNAVSPPGGDLSIAAERPVIEHAIGEIGGLAEDGKRLLLVHGNGPQVGRLLVHGGGDGLDVYVAQSQGELGYLLAEALDRRLGGAPAVAVITRTIVDAEDPAFEAPDKPIGPIAAAPGQTGTWRPAPGGRGWRQVVASPRPRGVLEVDAIRALLASRHVIAGGGGGVAITGRGPGRSAPPAVVDKDWVASLLAVTLDADRLIFITDVPRAFDGFGSTRAEPIASLSLAAARQRLAQGVFAPGSMAPKIEAAVLYAEATGRPALIAGLGGLAAALTGTGGTTIHGR